MIRTFRRGKTIPPAEEEERARQASSGLRGSASPGGEPEARSPRPPGASELRGGRLEDPVRGSSARVFPRPANLHRTGHGRRGGGRPSGTTLGPDRLSPGARTRPPGQPGRPHGKRRAAGTTPQRDRSGMWESWGSRGAKARADRRPPRPRSCLLTSWDPPGSALGTTQEKLGSRHHSCQGCRGAGRGRPQERGGDGAERVKSS